MTLPKLITLSNGRQIGPGAPCFFIAEVGMNHNGDVDLAKAMIDAALEAGADAVKFQMFDAVSFVHSSVLSRERDANGNPLPKQASLKGIEFTFEQWRDIADHARQVDIPFFVTPLDMRSMAWVRDLSLPLVKIASGDNDYLPLIRECAMSGIPTVLSTGMSTLQEVTTAVSAFRAAGGSDLMVLQCTSAYPSDPKDSHVLVVPAFQELFEVPAGLSDHCMTNGTAFAAVAQGASVIEKHFTTDRGLPGVDQAMSLDPIDFKSLVSTSREIEAALGNPEKTVLPKEEPVRDVARRSLYATRSIQAGEILDESMLIAMRPAGGLPVSDWDKAIGRPIARKLEAGERLKPEDLG